MKVKELRKLLDGIDGEKDVYMTFEGFEQTYEVGEVKTEIAFHKNMIELRPEGELEFSDLAGAAEFINTSDLIDEQIEALDAIIDAEKLRTRLIQEGLL